VRLSALWYLQRAYYVERTCCLPAKKACEFCVQTASWRFRERSWCDFRFVSRIVCAVVGVSTAHGRVLCRLGFHLFSLSDPQDVVTPYEDLSESARADTVYELLRVGELDVHVEVHRDESTLVLGLPPL
jgi:hypothetical protein